MPTIRCFLFAIFFQTLHSTTKLRKVNKVPDIIGGEYTTIDKFPYAIAILTVVFDSQFCGGSVLKKDVVITAAHCITYNVDGKTTVELTPAEFIYTVAGHENYKSAKAITRKVTKVLPHPCYSSSHLKDVFDDIGLIYLSKELPFGIIKPIKITRIWPEGVKKADTYGWGMTSLNKTESINYKKTILKYVTVNVYKSRKCCIIHKNMKKFYNLTHKKHPGLICVGNRHAIKTNNTVHIGDSGSGLVLPGGTQIGLTSYSNNYLMPGVAFFMNVSYYYDWIMDHAK